MLFRVKFIILFFKLQNEKSSERKRKKESRANEKEKKRRKNSILELIKFSFVYK